MTFHGALRLKPRRRKKLHKGLMFNTSGAMPSDTNFTSPIYKVESRYMDFAVFDCIPGSHFTHCMDGAVVCARKLDARFGFTFNGIWFIVDSRYCTIAHIERMENFRKSGIRELRWISSCGGFDVGDEIGVNEWP